METRSKLLLTSSFLVNPNENFDMVMPIKPHTLPTNSLLQPYANREGCYTDCYATDLPADIPLPDYITAFYTTPLFKLERFILKIAVRRPSTDQDVIALANTETTRFAAWDVEGRTDSQLLMCDLAGRTRSWFMVEPTATGTRLYFGSAVTPIIGTAKRGVTFNLLLPFHKIYSRALLWSAVRRLKR